MTIPLLGQASRHPAATVAVLAVLTAAGLYHFRGVPYNWNLLDLQARNLESVEYELKIIEESDRSTWYGAFIADRMDRVDAVIQALEPARDGAIVGAVESIRDYVQPDQDLKREILEPAREIIAGLELPAPSAELDSEALEASLDRMLDRLDRLQSLAASRGGEESVEQVRVMQSLIRRVEELQDGLAEYPPVVMERIAMYQRRWFSELRELRDKLVGLLDPPPIRPRDLPAEIHNRLVSEDESRFLVYAYPMKDIWDEDNMKEFVDAVRAVDPDVTGTPVQVYESANLMREGFLLSGLYSLVAVFILIVLNFRELKASVLAMIPLAVGMLWVLELMPLLGLDFNLANFFALPILVGYGVDGGVHIIHRFREIRSSSDVGRTTGSAVTLSSLTTIVGFGALSLAQHRGVASLGHVTALGTATILVASVVLLPSILEFLARRGRA